MSNQDKPPPEKPGEFWVTFGKALLTAIMGLVAIVALGATVCGLLLAGHGGWILSLVSISVVIFLLFAIIWLWR